MMMEIPEDKPRSLVKVKSVTGFILVFLAVALWLLWPASHAAHLPVSYVEDGRIAEKIPVFGYLKAEVERSIIPKVSGSVINKLARPGDVVMPETVILSLNNIEVEQGYVEAKMSLMTAEANIKELKSELLSQQRKLKNTIILSESKRALADVELVAKQKLFAEKVVSELDLKKAQLVSEQVRLEAQLAKDEFSDFEQFSLAKLAVVEARLEQAKAQLAVAQANKENLEVRAGMAGVIQDLDNNIKVGQWLDSGKNLGSVAQSSRLYAEVKVMASFAQLLEKGQLVSLEVKGQNVDGKVSHIEPNVVDNQIQIYVALDELPATARLNIEVTGHIVVFDKLALVAERPDYIEPGKKHQALWVIDDTGVPLRREVELGLVTSEKIEIISGLSAGEQIALSLNGDLNG